MPTKIVLPAETDLSFLDQYVFNGHQINIKYWTQDAQQVVRKKLLKLFEIDPSSVDVNSMMLGGLHTSEITSLSLTVKDHLGQSF